jgi:hypothetical protein
MELGTGVEAQDEPAGEEGEEGGGIARNRKEEERERNVATFGEPGGVGLELYIGGYGRRGGRPRRGAGAGPVQQQVLLVASLNLNLVLLSSPLQLPAANTYSISREDFYHNN